MVGGGFLIRSSLLGLLCLATGSISHAMPSRDFSLLDQIIQRPVRVRLEKDTGLLKLKLRGLPNEATVVKKSPQNKWVLLEVRRVHKSQGAFWRLRKMQDGIESIELRPGGTLLIEANEIREQDRALPKRLMLFENGEHFDLIATVSIEDYVTGVVSSEMPLAWPIEALKAQAIAARSYTLAVMRERRYAKFDVDNNVNDQVFNFIGKEFDADPMFQKGRLAVAQTRGVVLLDQNNRIAKAYYHADCGGHTSPAKIVWGFGEKTPVVVDASCPGHPRSKWVFNLSESELRKKLQRKWNLQSPIRALQPLASKEGDRAWALKVSLLDKSEQVINADEFREALGYSELRSTFFSVQKTGEVFEFRGRGWGHGVGLCQWGSRRLAQSGQKAFAILSHYYPLSHLNGEIKDSPEFAQRRTAQQE